MYDSGKETIHVKFCESKRGSDDLPSRRRSVSTENCHSVENSLASFIWLYIYIFGNCQKEEGQSVQ